MPAAEGCKVAQMAVTGTSRLRMADDHAVVRYGLCARMETVPASPVVGPAVCQR